MISSIPSESMASSLMTVDSMRVMEVLLDDLGGRLAEHREQADRASVACAICPAVCIVAACIESPSFRLVSRNRARSALRGRRARCAPRLATGAAHAGLAGIVSVRMASLSRLVARPCARQGAVEVHLRASCAAGAFRSRCAAATPAGPRRPRAPSARTARATRPPAASRMAAASAGGALAADDELLLPAPVAHQAPLGSAERRTRRRCRGARRGSSLTAHSMSLG